MVASRGLAEIGGTACFFVVQIMIQSVRVRSENETERDV